MGNLVRGLLANAIQPFLLGRGMALASFPKDLPILRDAKLREKMDLFRVGTLQYLRDEIYENKVPGDIAELGVYRGDFARYINVLFPDRKFYLFDTFEGFSEKDQQTERQKSFSAGKPGFQSTSVELVLSKLKHREQAIVKQGYFPESAAGVDARFAFVSLDPDLYEPTLAGLNYFVPRINPGGFIFIHDYTNPEYKGARVAVQEFCKANGLQHVPIADGFGSTIIAV